jgi:hypothetical protein
MLRRHIDFFAVFFIAVVMIAFSEVRYFTPPVVVVDPIRLQNVVNNSNSCPISREVLSRIAHILEQ